MTSTRAAARRFETLCFTEFWFHYRQLPDAIRELADKNFDLLKSDSRHPSLRLKKVGRFWSVGVGLHYRALARDRADGLVWFWIGPHHTYDNLIS